MADLDLEQLENLAEGLALFFYLLMFMALVTALSGSAGSAFFVLVLGSVAQIGRAGLLEFVDRERSRSERSRSRLRAVPVPAAQPPRRPATAGPEASVPAPERAAVRLR